LELLLLYILSTRDNYYRFRGFIKDHTVTKEIATIIKDMEDWYSSTGLDTISWGNYRAWFLTVKHVAYKPDKVDVFNKIFDNLESTSPPADTEVRNIIEAFIERDYATKIADHTLRIAEGEDLPLESVSEFMGEWSKETDRVDKLESSFVTKDFEKIVANTILGGGYDWRLPELNLALGPLRKGDFIVVGARPDSGKTTFLCSEAGRIAEQLKDDEIVLWVNNEEGGEKVKYRIIQAILGWDNTKMVADVTNTYRTYKDKLGGLDRIEVYDPEAPVQLHDVAALLKKYNVGLLVFDQLWKVHGFEKESTNEVNRFQMLFQWARELAKKYGPILDVHQARGDAEGNRWVYMNQFHNTQTVLQGEADAIITMGRSHESGFEKSRFLFVPKNKMSGGPKSDDMYRNGKFEIEIQPEIARFKSTI